MEFLTAGWMPIVVSAFLVWIASFLCHMILPHHKSEFRGLPNEDQFNETMGSVAPGLYMFQYCNPKDMNNPEVKARMEKGPNGIVTIWPGVVNMGQNLGLTLLFYLVVGAFVAYIFQFAVGDTVTYMDRFRIAAILAFMGHGLGWIPFVIWFRIGKFWPNLLDSIIFALLTAGTFAAFWPHATS